MIGIEEARAIAKAEEDYTPAPLEASIEQARGLAARYAGVEGLGLPEPMAPPGPCYDCGERARSRWLLGILLLCRSCRLSRYMAGEKVAAEA